MKTFSGMEDPPRPPQPAEMSARTEVLRMAENMISVELQGRHE
jgi:hypothetical protein